MNTNVIKKDKTLLLELDGRLDTVTAPELEKCLGDNMDGIQSVVFDFQKLSYISSAGLRVLLSTLKKMKGINGSMKLQNVNELIMEILESVGFLDIMTVENEKEDK